MDLVKFYLLNVRLFRNVQLVPVEHPKASLKIHFVIVFYVNQISSILSINEIIASGEIGNKRNICMDMHIIFITDQWWFVCFINCNVRYLIIVHIYANVACISVLCMFAIVFEIGLHN